MNIDETPKVVFTYDDNNSLGNGTGGQIPVFIGYTGNTTQAQGIKKFRSYTEASKTVAEGGIGPYTDNNLLLEVLRVFFEENKKVNVDDPTVPYVYAIDLGVKSELVLADWVNAIELAKNVYDAQVEVYVGFKKTDTQAKIIPIINAGIASAKEYAKGGLPRELYSTVFGASDDELKDYTDATNGVQSSWFGLPKPQDFGKIVNMI